MEITLKQVRQLIMEFTGQDKSIVIPRVFVDLTGDYTSAALLNQVLYWSERTHDDEGWFYKSAKEWEEELGLSNFQISRAMKVLKPLGVEIKLKRANNAPTLHYRINADIFYPLFFKFLENRQTRKSTNSKMDIEETRKSDIEETAKTLTESTHESTTENTKSVVETTSLIPIVQSEMIVKKARNPKSTYPKSPKQDNPYLENEGVQAYQKVFKKPPDIDQSLEIVTRVTDATRFESVCHEWKLNGWRAKSVASMIDRYEKQGALLDGTARFNGTGYNGRSTLVGNGSRTFNKAQGGSGPGGRYTKAELDDDLGGSNHRKNRPIVAGTACS
jgi:hypothetical protein